MFATGHGLSVQEVGEEGPDLEVEGQRPAVHTGVVGDGRADGEGHHDLADGPDIGQRRPAGGEVVEECAVRTGDEKAVHLNAG
jgi:hypothetical protein